jgi:hypothetical protein
MREQGGGEGDDIIGIMDSGTEMKEDAMYKICMYMTFRYAEPEPSLSPVKFLNSGF